MIDFIGDLLRPALLEMSRESSSLIWKRLQSRISDKDLKRAKQHIENLGMVKTLWSMDKAIHLNEFFCLTKLSRNNTSATHKSISDFESRNCLIFGPAGQGKSIYLRYLSVNELKVGKYIPVFLELRRINTHNHVRTVDKGETLKVYITEVLSMMGLPTTDLAIQKVFTSEKFVFMLDGFDELTSDNQQVIAQDLEYFCQKHLNINFFVTTRPDTIISGSPFFTNYHMAPLSNSEIDHILRKLAVDDRQETALIAAVKSNYNINKLITTPLLVVIMVIVYKSYRDLPETLPEFYEELFVVLLRRHDRTKAGFNRHRSSGLDDVTIQKIFNALSFLASIENKVEMSEQELNDLTERALNKELLKGISAADFNDDIIKITNLIIRDGRNFKFSHKTIQEYFASKYITLSSDRDAEKFYRKIRQSKELIETWRQHLIFLSEIDSLRYKNFYILPGISDTGLFSLDDRGTLLSKQVPSDYHKGMDVELNIKRVAPARPVDDEQPTFTYTYHLRIRFKRYFDTHSELYKRLTTIVNNSICEFLEKEDLSVFFAETDKNQVVLSYFTDLSLSAKCKIADLLSADSEYISIWTWLQEQIAFIAQYQSQRSISRELSEI